MPRALGDVASLVAGIHRRAEQEGLAMEDAAATRAAGIRADTEDRAARAAEEVRRRAALELAAATRRIRAQGALEVQRLTLAAREALLDRVWRDVDNRLRELVAGPEYLMVLRSLALLAARELRRTPVSLAADPAGHRLLTDATLADWSAAAGVVLERAGAPADTWGGLVARAGRTQYDATLSDRLEVAKEALGGEVLARLGWTRG